MKMYLNNEQTAKLIELGFEPSTRIPFEVGNDEFGRTFSIGELIEMLPIAIGANYLEIFTPISDGDVWGIAYGWHDYDEFNSLYYFFNKEFIDALYEMVVKLKEEGLI